jgi:hypothetical protein
LFEAVNRRADQFEYREHGAGSTRTAWCCGSDTGTSSEAIAIVTPRGVPRRSHRRRPTIGAAAGFEPPAVDPFVRDPLTYGSDQPVDALVLVDATRAALVIDELGEAAVVERRDHGAVVVGMPVVNRTAFRTWVLDLLEHAEVLGPPELRDEFVEWLRALT